MLNCSVSLIFALILFTPVAAESFIGVPKSRALDYVVMRNGVPIGKFAFRFRLDGAKLKVAIDSKIEYRLFFIRVYYHLHQSKEIWNGKRLISMKSVTDDNGEEKNLYVSQNKNNLEISGPKGEMQVGAETPPASFWNVVSLESPKMIGTISGGIEIIKTEFIGDEAIEIRGRSVKTKHYRMTGDIKRDLWFNTEDNLALAHLRFEARDGSTIEYVMK